MKDIEGTAWPISRIKQQMAGLPLPVVLDWATRVSARLQRNRETQPFDQAAQFELLGALTCPNGRLRRKIRGYVRRMGRRELAFFDEAQVLLAVRIATECCVLRDIPDKAPHIDEFAQTLIALSDHLSPAEPDKEDEYWALRNLLPDILFRTAEYSRNALVRWRMLLADIPDALRDDPRWVDIDAEFATATGVVMSDFRAIVMAVFANLHEIAKSWDLQRPGLMTSIGAWFGEATLSRAERGIIGGLMTTPDELLAEFRLHPPTQDAPYDFLPLRKRPIIQVDRYAWCPNMDLLFDLATSGVYHRLFTYYADRRDNTRRQRLSDFLGLVFEDYVCRLLHGSPSCAGTKRIYRVDEVDPGAASRKCDLVLVEGDCVVLLECKFHLFRQTTATRADLRDYREDLNRLVGTAAPQLRQTIAEIRSGKLPVPGLTPERVRLYVPAVVTVQEVPTDPFTARVLRALIEPTGLATRSGNVLPLQTMDVATLESLCPNLTPERGLADFLSSASDRVSEFGQPVSLRNHFWQTYGLQPQPNAYLEDAGAKHLDEMLQFWKQRAPKETPTAARPRLTELLNCSQQASVAR